MSARMRCIEYWVHLQCRPHPGRWGGDYRRPFFSGFDIGMANAERMLCIDGIDGTAGISPHAIMPVAVRTVERPPTWRRTPYVLSYLLTPREVDARELIELLTRAHAQQLPNPRVITPALASWSSLLHPRFYASVHDDFPVAVPRLAWADDAVPGDFPALSRLWLESVLFLSGVTLSAAIIQGRYSAGTIGSKFDRLWDAGTLAALGVAHELRQLDLHARIRALVAEGNTGVPLLLQLRELFMQALALIAPRTGAPETLRCTEALSDDDRFGFVATLRATLGRSLHAVVVYGSSVSSAHFADIDALVVTDDPVSALRQLANTSPVWRGKELNLGVYSPGELLVMQRLSGDNLSEYGVCAYGATAVVRKPKSALLARNFSFGMIRQRQQFGMLSREIGMPAAAADRFNLNQYFVKIPANVAKGTFGAVGRRLPKEHVHDWLKTAVGFDTPGMQAQAARGQVIDALAQSSLATGLTLHALNRELRVIRDQGARSTEMRRHSS